MRRSAGALSAFIVASAIGAGVAAEGGGDVVNG